MTAEKPTVLLVEDDETLARTVIRALAKHCHVLHAPSSALALSKVNDGGFSAMICDWDLGDGTGAAALILCARIQPAVRRIVYSGHSHEEIVAAVPEGVVDGFVQKPDVPAALIKALGFTR